MASGSYGDLGWLREGPKAAYQLRGSNPERLQQLFALYEPEASDLAAAGCRRRPSFTCFNAGSHFNLLEHRWRDFGDGAPATIGRIRAPPPGAEVWLEEAAPARLPCEG